MNIPELMQSLFNDKDQDVMAIHDADEGLIKAWRVERLKLAAEGLEVVERSLTDFNPSMRIWFGDDASNCRLSDVVSHLKRVREADTSVPIIIFDGNQIVDGAHRFVRALFDEKDTILCRVITDPPDPDLIIPVTADGRQIIAN